MAGVWLASTTGLPEPPPLTTMVLLKPTSTSGAGPKVMTCACSGVTGLDGADSGPSPARLLARTVSVCVTPLSRPPTVMLLHGALQLALAPPGVAVAV